MDIVDFLDSVWRPNLHPSASVVANWASVLSLFVILFNTWRLSKISRFIEHEREKIEDIVKPFDLYCEIQEAIQDLQRHGPYELMSDGQKRKILEGLVASKSCLDLYFRQIHDFKGDCDNVYLAAAHRYWDRKKTDKALENFEKAAERADTERELAECLYGLRACYTLKKQPYLCAFIDQELNKLIEGAEPVDPSQYAKSTVTMAFFYLRSYFRTKSTKDKSVLPTNFKANPPKISGLVERLRSRHRSSMGSQVNRGGES